MRDFIPLSRKMAVCKGWVLFERDYVAALRDPLPLAAGALANQRKALLLFQKKEFFLCGEGGFMSKLIATFLT